MLEINYIQNGLKKYIYSINTIKNEKRVGGMKKKIPSGLPDQNVSQIMQ